MCPAKTEKDRHKMTVKVATTRFIGSSVKRYAGYYQQLLANISTFQELGDRLIRAAEVAHAFRKVEQVAELGLLLSNLPLKEYQLIGQYYLGWCAYRRGESPREVFEAVIENSETYRARALMSLAAIAAREGNTEGELKHFSEALKYAQDISTHIDIAKGIAVIKAKEGYHTQAVNELESLTPLLRYAKPIVYYSCLNSLAVELGEVGSIEEAKSISNILLASSIVSAYPECQDTAKELEMKSRSKRASCITVPAIPAVIEERKEKPGIETNIFLRKKKRAKAKKRGELTSVYLFPQQKEDIPQVVKPDAVSKDELRRMTTAEKRAMVLAVIYDQETRGQDYEKILEAVGLVREEPLREIDLESRSELDDLVTDWCGLLGAEEFARVLSALRDCDDHWRLSNIIDMMITVAFHKSRSSMKSEEEWRKQVEAHLKPEK
jgi:tetratricopeptide (TPR) repeat protein